MRKLAPECGTAAKISSTKASSERRSVMRSSCTESINSGRYFLPLCADEKTRGEAASENASIGGNPAGSLTGETEANYSIFTPIVLPYAAQAVALIPTSHPTSIHAVGGASKTAQLMDRSAAACKGLIAKADPCANIRGQGRARSSAGEHYVDIVGVTGSIPVAPTTLCPMRAGPAGEFLLRPAVP
ncbi:hypothetical protein DF3PA_420008 [Candidatus Defluviicoccus seviourii]|uniref:Uncharacterized protein n=1 Tax=Candidatus Defluviicoccus seviourii TaxID=2565273 RepID=A0A564WGR4_9PROT|nr:hypothetical protein DF3PA_420008 [Candidatus Defluviicoccus seviourii]